MEMQKKKLPTRLALRHDTGYLTGLPLYISLLNMGWSFRFFFNISPWCNSANPLADTIAVK